MFFFFLTEVSDNWVEVKNEPLDISEPIELSENEDEFRGFRAVNASVASSSDQHISNMWPYKATSCLITQYKKHRFTKFKNLRELFELISRDMEAHGFSYNAQKCENKWRVLERRYKSVVHRERLKKPSRRMRYSEHWEHKSALDEIFVPPNIPSNTQNDDQSRPSRSESAKRTLPRTYLSRENGRRKSKTASKDTIEQDEEIHPRTLRVMFEKFIFEMNNNFVQAEKSKQKRHNEKMDMREKELEVMEEYLKLKERKFELLRCQLMTAANLCSTNNKK